MLLPELDTVVACQYVTFGVDGAFTVPIVHAALPYNVGEVVTVGAGTGNGTTRPPPSGLENSKTPSPFGTSSS